MDVIKYDFENISKRLKAKVLNKLGGENFLMISTNAALIDAVAEELDDFAMYNEYLARESSWTTAKNPHFVMQQIDFFGYSPHRKISSTGTVRFSTSKTFNGRANTNITIPKWTQVSGGGVAFITREEATLASNKNYVDVSVVQGELAQKTIPITMKDFPIGSLEYAQIPILDSNIENTAYIVKVGKLGSIREDPWKEVSNVRSASGYDNPGEAEIFAIKTMDSFKGVTLFFGNNSLGKALNYDDIVEFTYVKSDGIEGNILAKGVINNVDSVIKDAKGDTINLFCSNVTELIGGQDNESVDSIKKIAPLSFQTVDRAVTAKDYEILLKKNGYADGVLVWGETELNDDQFNLFSSYTSGEENTVHITGYKVEKASLLGTPFSEDKKTAILYFLGKMKGLTDIIKFDDTVIVYVNFKAVVYCKKNYSKILIKGLVEDALKRDYSLLRGADKDLYGSSLYLSDYLATIDNVEGVDHCNCEITFSEYADFNNDFAKNLLLNNIKEGSVSIKIKSTVDTSDTWQEVAHDVPDINSKGSFKGKNLFNVAPESFINYREGRLQGLTVTNLPNLPTNYQARIDFELNSGSGNLELSYRNQLFAWHTSDIKVV